MWLNLLLACPMANWKNLWIGPLFFQNVWSYLFFLYLKHTSTIMQPIWLISESICENVCCYSMSQFFVALPCICRDFFQWCGPLLSTSLKKGVFQIVWGLCSHFVLLGLCFNSCVTAFWSPTSLLFTQRTLLSQYQWVCSHTILSV